MRKEEQQLDQLLRMQNPNSPGTLLDARSTWILKLRLDLIGQELALLGKRVSLLEKLLGFTAGPNSEPSQTSPTSSSPGDSR